MFVRLRTLRATRPSTSDLVAENPGSWAWGQRASGGPAAHELVSRYSYDGDQNPMTVIGAQIVARSTAAGHPLLLTVSNRQRVGIVALFGQQAIQLLDQRFLDRPC